MKKLIIIIFGCFIFSFVYSQQDLLPAFTDEITYQGDRAYFSGSPFTGLLIDKNTNVRWGEYKNGFKNGMFTEYYSNGKKKSEGNFINGVKDGNHFEWYEDGNIKSEINYSNGLKNGLTTLWYPNGNKEFEGIFNNDKKDRVQTVWFENGQKQKVQEFMNNEANGKLSIWYENGQILKELIYEYGDIKNGNYTTYLENGQKEKEEYYVNGIKTSEGIYKGNDLYRPVIEYYPNGEKKAEGQTKNDLKDGIWNEWYLTGEKKTVINYYDGNISEVIYENKNDPAFAIKKIRKPGSNIYRKIDVFDKDTSYVMVTMNFNIKTASNRINNELTTRFKNEFSSCLGSLNKMSETEISNNTNKSITYSIDLSNLGYEIKRFKASSAFPGQYNYTGAISINMKIKNIRSDKTIFNNSFSEQEAYTYPLYKSDVDVLMALPAEICYKLSSNINSAF